MQQLNQTLIEAAVHGLAGPATAVARLGAIEAKLTDMVSGPAGLDERFDDLQAQLNEMSQHLTRLSQINLAQLEALREIALRVPAMDILQAVTDRIAKEETR